MSRKEEKQIIQKGVDETTAYYQQKYEQEQIRRKRKKPTDPARPSLIKRFAGILLDTLCIGIVVFGVQTAFYHTLYKPMGYFKDQAALAQMNDESHLYVKNEIGRNVKISEQYDSNKTPEQNYDEPITYYYSTDARCIDNHKLEDYNAAKSSSILFELKDGVYVRSLFATNDNLIEFYKPHYEEAIKFFKSNPDYIKHANHSLLVTVSTMMLNVTISSSIFYLLIPMLDKRHRTVGMLATRTILVEKEKKEPSTKQQVLMRYLAVLLMNFLAPCGLYILQPSIIGIIWFINLGITCFTPDFDSLQGVFSKTKVINASFSNPMESYKQIQDMIEMEKKNNPDAFKKEEE